MARTRLYSRTSVGGALDYSQVMPFNGEVLQITVALDAAPTTSEDFQIEKLSGVSPVYTTLLRALDLSASSAVDVQFPLVGEFLKDDQIRVIYTNTDANTVSVEIVVREAK